MRQGGENAFHKSTLKEVVQEQYRKMGTKVSLSGYHLLYPKVGSADWDFCSPQQETSVESYLHYSLHSWLSNAGKELVLECDQYIICKYNQFFILLCVTF